MRQRARHTGVVTFAGHPSDILPTRPKVRHIATLPHKLLLLKECGVDLLILREFSQELASQPYDHFLDTLRTSFPFSLLVLGKGARFGYQAAGDEANVTAWALKRGVEVTYVDPLCDGPSHISSERVRQALHEGDIQQAEHLLGRPYSLLLPLRLDPNNPQRASASLKGLCLLPPHSYPVQVGSIAAIARIDAIAERLTLELHTPSPHVQDQWVPIHFAPC